MARTLQSNIKQYDRDMTRYSLFLGGLNVKNAAIEQYDPLVTGFGRIFFLKMPRFMEEIMPTQTKNIKHLMEYGNIAIDGIQNTTLEMEGMTGSYSGKQFEVATVSKDDTNSLTIKVYEFAGSPVREYMDMWITGISDPFTGIGHYHGAISDTIKYSAVNHTAEAIYAHTGPTGLPTDIEYSCMLSNLIPKTCKKDHFNYEAGSHPIVETEIEFTTVKYESPQINEVAKELLSKYLILRDYLDFQSGYDKNYIDKNLPNSNIQDWAHLNKK